MTRIVRLAALAALVFPLAALAQPTDRPDRGDRAEHRIERLTETLSLTDAQAAMVRSALAAEPSPEASWALAADLAPTLSASQLATLKAPRAERRAERGGDRADRPRRQRPDRDGASGETTSAERAERREQRRAEMAVARDAALGLSAQQKQALESLREGRQRGGVPAEMAEVLTDDQEAVFLVHRALSGPRGHRRGGRGGRGKARR